MSLLSRFRTPPSPGMDLSPDAAGRTWLVTGATNGIGRELARMVAREGRRLIITARDAARGENVAAELRELGSRVDVIPLDLSRQSSVRAAAESIRALGTDIDVLVDNAGGVTGKRVVTADGFERMLAINFLGPFALTNLVADLVRSRIVITGSNVHRKGHIDSGDPHFENRAWTFPAAYGQSKLADQLWATALQVRLDAAERGIEVLTAHPGWAHTNIQNATGIAAVDGVLDFACGQFALSAREGAMPLLEACAGNHPPLSYIGPDGLADLWGAPGVQEPSALSRSQRAADRLWELGVRETGIDLEFRTRPLEAPKG